MSGVEQYLISLDRFTVVKELGKAAFGFVLLVEDKETKQKFAAKVINEDNEENRRKALEEIEIIGQLHHQTIVNFIGYSPVDFEGKDHITIVTEFQPNGDLHDAIKKGKLDNTQKQIILVGICRSLMYLHEKKLIHRDLKPYNVLIDEKFHPHLTDFFLMKKYSPGEENEVMIGTPLYMAPEIVQTGIYDCSVDIFSFAITMVEIIEGKIELNQKIRSPQQYMMHVVKGDRPIIHSQIKKPIRDLIEQCWSEKPSDRLTAEQLFQKLAYDPDYYLDGVNADEIKSYADSIKQ